MIILAALITLADPWTPVDTVAIATLTAESFYDTATTEYCLDHQGCYEGNPLWGRHPGRKLWIDSAVSTALIGFLFYLLPTEYRRMAEGLTIGFETGILVGNYWNRGYTLFQLSF